MAFQKEAQLDLTQGYEGSFVTTVFYPTNVYSVNETNGIKIGTFAWFVLNTNNQVAQIKGTNTQLAGFVVRNNSNVNLTQGITTNSSLTILNKYPCEIANRGIFYAKLVTVIGSNPVATGSSVYVINATGEIAADGGSILPESGVTKTNFKFISVPSELTAGQLVKISNVSDVMGV
jgi:hypothetical protein